MTTKKTTEYRSLDTHVLAVAVAGEVGDWAAYIGEVPGENYNCEYGFVMIQGTKLPREVAKILFPGWARMAWRD